MQKLITELKQIVRFKDSTDIGDLVLIIAKEPQMMASYALVTDIERDTSRKNEWWHVRLTLLSLPPQDITWTLRAPQFTGMEVFTMGGEERFVKAVDFSTIPLQSKVTDRKGVSKSQAKPKARNSEMAQEPGMEQERPAPVSTKDKKESFLKRVK
jgi:hypothetical protein